MTAPPLRFSVAPDHPSLPGHFPGRPVVPGVVALDHAMSIILEHIGAVRLAGFGAVKFVTPVLPGCMVDVTYDRIAEDRVSFACTIGGVAALHGTARIAAA